MSYSHIQTENRTYALRQPDGWKVRYPRWMLELPEHVDEVLITYVGVQPRTHHTPAKGVFTDLHPHVTKEAQLQAAAKIEHWIVHDLGIFAPQLWEKFYVETGYDVPDTEVWVLYWTDRVVAEAALKDLSLERISSCLSPEPAVGLWRESFSVPKTRFETVYSGNDYQPGLAALDGAQLIKHTYTGYWGAARDRLPASAQDNFLPQDPPPAPDFKKDTKNCTLRGHNQDVLLHIRSGQWWARCPEDERNAYEENLEPVLRKGMAYLEDNAAESGDFGLRFMRNLVSNRHVQSDEAQDTNGAIGADDTKASHSTVSPPRRMETCSAGFFRSLKDLEHWASKHSSHLKIFHGAHAHSTTFGKETFKMRTWHEVAILKPGEISFEYMNCEPRTGLIPFVDDSL